MCSSVNPIKHDPPWSPEEHLERVYRRGRQLRRRRQVGVTSAALVAVVGLAVGIAGSTSPLVHPIQVLTGSNHSDNNKASATTTSTTEAPDVALGPSTTVGAGASPTAKRSGSGTAAVPSGGSTVVTSGNTDDTPPTSPLGDCKTADLRYVTATNKSSYRANELVDISLRVRNAGDRPCYVPSACSAGAWASVQRSSDGATVWENSSHLVGCTKPATQPLLNPGDTHDYGLVGSWNQTDCPNPGDTDGCDGTRSAVGTYTATAHRGNTVASPATIALR
jgi:hypothetical protein